MKLIDLLSIIDANINVKVFVGADNVSTYDGKDSIDSKYNDFDVFNMTIVNNTIHIELSPK